MGLKWALPSIQALALLGVAPGLKFEKHGPTAFSLLTTNGRTDEDRMDRGTTANVLQPNPGPPLWTCMACELRNLAAANPGQLNPEDLKSIKKQRPMRGTLPENVHGSVLNLKYGKELNPRNLGPLSNSPIAFHEETLNDGNSLGWHGSTPPDKPRL